MQFKLWTFAIAALILTAISVGAGAAARAETRSFRIYAVEINGVKFWLPSTIVVKKGDHVKIEATSKVPGINSVHGLEIPAFNIKEVADAKGKTVEFDADKSGVFPFDCQLHAPHVGGEIVVLD